MYHHIYECHLNLCKKCVLNYLLVLFRSDAGYLDGYYYKNNDKLSVSCHPRCVIYFYLLHLFNFKFGKHLLFLIF